MRSARRFRGTWLAAMAVSAACSGCSTPPGPSANVAAACNAALWNHVYAPARLNIVDACRTVTGVVTDLHTNEDGDLDMRLAVDPPFATLLNAGNIANLDGHLQLESVCQIPPVTPDAREACGSFRGAVYVPSPGQHISATGTYVLDTNHGWMEIHPVSVITVLQP
jgi:hypothetical protein